MTDKYNYKVIHFDKQEIPNILIDHLPVDEISFADLGCGDGPWFQILLAKKIISPSKSVYAVDTNIARLDNIKKRFPWITTIACNADSIPEIEDKSIDWVFSTMVMEHIPDEVKYLLEIKRILNPRGRAYISTVFKHKRAWYFRKRNGESVLDTLHLREYTDMDSFRKLITDNCGMIILDLEKKPMKFPLMDPLIFLVGKYIHIGNRFLKFLRKVKVPIFGFYELHVIFKSN